MGSLTPNEVSRIVQHVRKERTVGECDKTDIKLFNANLNILLVCFLQCVSLISSA